MALLGTASGCSHPPATSAPTDPSCAARGKHPRGPPTTAPAPPSPTHSSAASGDPAPRCCPLRGPRPIMARRLLFAAAAAVPAAGSRKVSFWFGPSATAPCPTGPPPAPPPAPPGCLPDCSWTPCNACITGCPDRGSSIPGNGGHGCNVSGTGTNRCACNAMGYRKASNCSAKASRGLKLCPGPPTNECRSNVSFALATLKQEGGSQVATSFFLYCGLPHWGPS